MFMGGLPEITSIHHVCAPSACGSQLIVSDPLELLLQLVVSHPVGAGNRTQVLSVKGSQCFNHWSIPPAPRVGFIRSEENQSIAFLAKPT